MATTYITTDPQILYESILSLTMKPWVIGLTFFNFAFLVPLLEEMIKAMATLPLIRRKITPAQGFLGGALAGALRVATRFGEALTSQLGVATGSRGRRLIKCTDYVRMCTKGLST